MSEKKKIESIQALRAFASPIVALSHLLNIAVAFGGSALLTAKISLHVPADAAVACFFTVSGFIMTMLADKGRSPLDFALRRVVRIFPTYWIALPVMLVLPALPGAAHFVTWPQIALLSTAAAHPITWALVFEIYFYILVTIIMICCRGSVTAGFALFATAHVLMIHLVQAGLAPAHQFLQPAAASFWVGSSVYLATAKLKSAWASLTVIILAVGSLLLSTDFGHEMRGNNMVLYAAIFGPIFVLMIATEKLAKFSVPKYLIWWSNRSYALFLWHVPVMVVSVQVVQKISSFESPIGVLIFSGMSFFGSVAAALFGYKYVELPITTFLNGMLRKIAPRQSTLNAGAGAHPVEQLV